MRSLEAETVRHWTRELTDRGYTPTPLAAGVEGAVFRLGNDAVAKVWNSRPSSEITRLATFYRIVAVAGLPFRTPEIYDIGELGDAAFSIERELPGVPLFPDHSGQSPTLDHQRFRCVTDVLTALAAVHPTDDMNMLPVLDERTPLRRRGDTFNDALARLVTRRLGKALSEVTAAIDDADDLAQSVVHQLASMPVDQDALVHGDLIPANILVDDDSTVAAVLDFGFFSTRGSPAFDAAVTANIFDMYGPNRTTSRRAMDQLMRDAFAYPPEVLTVYLSAYALATMTMFGTSEHDGHFRWCADVLRRPEVLDVLAP